MVIKNMSFNEINSVIMKKTHRPQIKNYDASLKKIFIGDLSKESIEKKL